jgi:formate dehydrogenase major subunit
MITATIDGVVQQAASSERLIDVINRAGVKISQVCYHPQLGPIQTRDTCMVENNGRLVRACATNASDGMEIFARTEKGSLTLTIVFS